MSQLNSFKYYDASPYQKGVYLKHHYAKSKISPYNISVSKNAKSLNLEVFQKTINYMMDRHEIFRTSIVDINGEIKQQVWPYNDSILKVEFTDLTKIIDKDGEINEIKEKARNTYFPSTLIPWLNVKTIKLNDITYQILITIPHVISDNESIKEFLSELTVVYKCLVQNTIIYLSKPSQFGEYVDKCSEIIRNKENRYKTFWMGILKDIPKKNLSTVFSENKQTIDKSYKSFILLIRFAPFHFL